MPAHTIADGIIGHQLDLLRLSAHVNQQVVDILNALQRELTYRLATEELTAFNKARLQSMLVETISTINDYYARIQAATTGILTGVGESAATYTHALVASLGGGLPTETFLARLVSNALIQGAASAAWWKRQAQDTAFKFANAVRHGIVQGLTNEQIMRNIVGSARLGITGVMDIARSNARSLVHTSIQAVANAAREETFVKVARTGDALVWLATLDPHTCVVCASRDLHTYEPKTHEPLDDGPPWGAGPGAIHWGCRCAVSIRVAPIEGMPLLPVGGRASSTGQVKGNTSFADYLERMGKQWQDDVLGKGRAQLWRDKKLTLEQLLDLRGSPLTLAQLQVKYG